MSEPANPPTPAEPAAAPAPAPPARPAPPVKPARALPSHDEIAAWARGGEVATIGALFEGLPTPKFDLLVTLMGKQDLLPQHWQVISRVALPAGADFESLPETARLRQRYGGTEEGRHRLEALRAAWEELRGKQPSLWGVGDLLAVLRRIIDKKRPVDLGHLLTAVRDVWLGLEVPHGRTQLALLEPCLKLARDKAK